MTKSNKIPVTIITGFLGAGKTTLLNRLITENSAKKFAIIENEFGDIPIDQELVVNAKDGIFEMSNGCICCSLNVELGELLQKLMSDEYDFNHLIIETTGIAEPDGIAAAFIGGNRETKFKLDGTICLADAHDIVKNLEERGEAHKQVAFSDLILLNKTDLVSKEKLLEAKNLIKKYNAEAPIHECSFGKVEKDLLDLNAYDGDRLENKLLNPHHHHHHNELVAHSFDFKEPILADKFEHWINMLLFLSGYQIYRIKGILNIEGETHKIIFQSVRSNSKIDVGSAWMEGEIRKSKIIFIGNNVKREPLEKGLKGCLNN
ncbi:MAG: GTP-binding protein [Cyclobacteriaceae bacterium]|nr:GTP-binding protein [Cyclobacteriaceae bacterium]